ncbi:hypothetical protein O9993_16655 [Vibrio lentus]|nr:hypothetical protein [Vibrio lentus]
MSEVYYRVQIIKNTGNGTEYGNRLEDTISAIQTRIAEGDSSTTALRTQSSSQLRLIKRS